MSSIICVSDESEDERQYNDSMLTIHHSIGESSKNSVIDNQRKRAQPESDENEQNEEDANKGISIESEMREDQNDRLINSTIPIESKKPVKLSASFVDKKRHKLEIEKKLEQKSKEIIIKPFNEEVLVENYIKTEMKNLESTLKEIINKRFDEFNLIRKESLMYKLRSLRKSKDSVIQTDSTSALMEKKDLAETKEGPNIPSGGNSIFGGSTLVGIQKGASLFSVPKQTEALISNKPSLNQSIIFSAKDQLGELNNEGNKNQEVITEADSQIQKVGAKRKFIGLNEPYKKHVNLFNPSITNPDLFIEGKLSTNAAGSSLFGNTTGSLFGGTSLFSAKPTELPGLSGSFGLFGPPQSKTTEITSDLFGTTKSNEPNNSLNRSEGGLFGNATSGLGKSINDLPEWVLGPKKSTNTEV